MVARNINVGINTPSGLSIGTIDTYTDDLKASKILSIRVHMPRYLDLETIELRKIEVQHALAKGMDVIWGVCGIDLTAVTWLDYKAKVLEIAAWAEANGLKHFLLGNEEESSIDGTTLDLDQLIINLKDLATEVKLIYTGEVSYSLSGDISYPERVTKWAAAGKGDMDTIGLNVYHNSITATWWRTAIDTLYAAFGEDLYLSEFAPNATSLDTYSTDEDIQASATLEMLNYSYNKGILKAYFFNYLSDNFGARKNDGTYRKLWEVLKRENGFYTGTASTSNIGGLSHG